MFLGKTQNMKKPLLLLLLSCFTLLNAQNPNLTYEAEISILTIGPGSSLNDNFGHNGFRVKTGYIDIVYNYGVYDFDTPNFYTKFAQGKLNYLLGVSYYEDFEKAYIKQNRTIKEQVLNLNQDQKRAFYSFLLNNSKPENRAYLYDFFYDNCATRIRDVSETVLKNNISYKTPKSYNEETFRTLIHKNLNWNSWGSFGIDLALGSVIDRTATPREYMFLPEYIYDFFEEASFKNTDKPIVKEAKLIYEEKANENQSYFFTSPLFVFILIGIIIILITYKDNKSSKRTKVLDIALFSLLGLIGVLLLLLWFATDHTATAYNYNLLWAFPLSLFVVIQVIKKEPKKWFLAYLKFLILMLCLMTLHWIIGVQRFAPVLIPLIVAFAIRYIYLLKFYKEKGSI